MVYDLNVEIKYDKLINKMQFGGMDIIYLSIALWWNF